MAKYNFEFKKKIVLEYLDGKGGYTFLTKKYNLSDPILIRRWIQAYKTFGDEGLMRSRQNKNYSFDKKLHVVELYLTTEVSYQELAIQEGIINPAMIVNWVQRFRAAGPDALRPHKKGRKKTLDKLNNISKSLSSEESSIDTSAEHVRELEEELLKLRIENAYLKELRRLRLEDEAKMRERQESSAASEDSLN